MVFHILYQLCLCHDNIGNSLMIQKTNTMKKNFYSVIAALIVCWSFSPSLSFSQNRDSIYVNAAYTGTTETGSKTQPFKTIRKALDKRASNGLAGMVTNEVIIVKAGTYYPKGTDMLLINRTNCGKNGKWLTIKSETPFGAIIRGDSLYKTMFAAIVSFSDSASYVKLENFIIEHIRNNPDSTKWKAANDPPGVYSSPVPAVVAVDNDNNPAKTLYGDTVYDGRRDVKFGIQISGDCRNITLFDNDISDISWTNAVDPYTPDSLLTENQKKILRNASGSDVVGPISIIGSDYHAMKNIILDGNEVHHCIPGYAEGIAVNGYIDSFTIRWNLVHDIKNIGIVAAGNYPWVVNPANNFFTPANQNYARNGVIMGNTVYNCMSPIAVSAGIYLDGAKNVLVERNVSYNNHVGISVGNEIMNTHSGGHTVRNNIAYDNAWTGIVLGSGSQGAWVENVKVLNNTFYKNNTQAVTLIPQVANGTVVLQNGTAVPNTFGDAGEIVAKRLSNSNDAPGAKIVFQNNIVRSRKGIPIVVSDTFRTNSYTTALNKSTLKNLLDWNYNLYYTQPGSNINYNFYSAGFTGNTYNFANYKTETGLDSNSVAIELSAVPSPDPVFVNSTAFPERFKLVSGSAAYNTGNPNSTNSGTDDFIWNERIMGDRIDAGALEFVVTTPPANRFSEPVSASTDPETKFSLFPNPAVNDITITTSQPGSGILTIAVWDMAGQLILTKPTAVTKGVNTIRINNLKQAGFTSGLYIFKLTGKGKTQAFKVVVQ